jgi:xanthine/CO dehydrogenase XdhC/CoxF family maturation factor
MKEIRDILRRADSLAEGQSRMVLATVVRLEGSSYRRPGARMLVSEKGEITGAISGGCLEGDALEKALLVMNQGRPRIVTYDTMDDDDPFGAGLGCNGILHVLMEPLTGREEGNALGLLHHAGLVRQPAVLATLFSLEDRKGPQAGTCLLLNGKGGWMGGLPGKSLESDVKTEMEKSMRSKRSAFTGFHTADGRTEAFIEYLPPPVSLVVVGAGNDAFPLVDMAERLGWETTVVDGRASHARPERFASGCRVMVSKPEQVLDGIDTDDRTAFVLLTHNYEYDKAVMRALLNRQVGYLGMLGPNKKCRRMLEELKREGETLSTEFLNRLYAPVGLDIGAEGPEEIAVSILAGICAAMTDRSGGHLRGTEGPIHSFEKARTLDDKPA